MSMMKVLPEIPALKASYSTGRVLRLPVNITVSVSYRCNSRCKTCNVWLLPNDDLTLPEWDRVYESLGSSPDWLAEILPVAMDKPTPDGKLHATGLLTEAIGLLRGKLG